MEGEEHQQQRSVAGPGLEWSMTKSLFALRGGQTKQKAIRVDTFGFGGSNEKGCPAATQTQQTQQTPL